ncbi:hypothetical protein H0H92_014748 [Tricholoma furcatifolium]|nr:hypothetical protein H0H92_014748 [Tricholoma furcatifolium]
MVHVVSFAVFIGPIAILIPLLLLHELVVAILFHMNFIFHGLRGPVDDHYLYLTSVFDDVKGSIFSSVDRWSTTYNKFTSEYWPLVLIRLACLGFGMLASYRIIHDLPVTILGILS